MSQASFLPVVQTTAASMAASLGLIEDGALSYKDLVERLEPLTRRQLISVISADAELRAEALSIPEWLLRVLLGGGVAAVGIMPIWITKTPGVGALVVSLTLSAMVVGTGIFTGLVTRSGSSLVLLPSKRKVLVSYAATAILRNIASRLPDEALESLLQDPVTKAQCEVTYGVLQQDSWRRAGEREEIEAQEKAQLAQEKAQQAPGLSQRLQLALSDQTPVAGLLEDNQNTQGHALEVS